MVMKSQGAIPADLIATLTSLPRLRAQLRDMSQDVSIGIPEAVAEALAKAIEALKLAEQTQAQSFLLVETTPALPAGRGLAVGTGLTTTDNGPGASYQIRLQAFLAALSQLTGNGIVAKTASGAELRTIEAGSNRIAILNGSGADGNPAIDIDEPSLDVGNMGGVLGIAHGGTGVDVFSAFSAHNNAVGQSIPSAVWTQLSMSMEDFDLNSDFAASAWTPPAGRLVTLHASVFISMTSPGEVDIAIYKNGVVYRRGNNAVGIGDLLVNVSCIDIPSGTDVYTVRAFQDSGVALSTNGAAEVTYFQGLMG